MRRHIPVPYKRRDRRDLDIATDHNLWQRTNKRSLPKEAQVPLRQIQRDLPRPIKSTNAEEDTNQADKLALQMEQLHTKANETNGGERPHRPVGTPSEERQPRLHPPERDSDEADDQATAADAIPRSELLGGI